MGGTDNIGWCYFYTYLFAGLTSRRKSKDFLSNLLTLLRECVTIMEIYSGMRKKKQEGRNELFRKNSL